ncbi:MAG: AAA family ATPase [Anaerolineae bacterium]|nr:AAA family ATPase [Anaerolineae bacterium]MDQ7035604.1 AAA family ATPase [Anaerolineae bacterium]
MSSENTKGSLWNKWDLHIHTPASYFWNEKHRYNEITDREVIQVIEKINEIDVEVVAIQDYWTFDGYIRLRKFLESGKSVTTDKLILPGMELRIEAPTDYRLNIHVVLSDDFKEQELIEFQNLLRIRELDRPPSRDAMIQLCDWLGEAKAARIGGKTLNDMTQNEKHLVGARTAEITLNSLEQALQRFEGRVLLLLPYDVYHGIDKLNWKEHPLFDTHLLRTAHIYETRATETIQLFNGIKTPKNEGYFDDFYSSIGERPKPCVRGSDAHKFDEYGQFHGNLRNITWIKAEPTFEGLLRALEEPVDRVFMGEEPEQLRRVRNNKTKYISSLTLSKTDNSIDDVWFDGHELEFNSGLVAVIGNKGSGKSALTDILAFLGHSEREKGDFGFLSKFRQKSTKGLAKKFEGMLQWVDGSISQNNLDTKDKSSSESVLYIPQQFFETICNETEIREDGRFYKELKKVIFSHVDSGERLGCDTLDELMNKRTDERVDFIRSLRQELARLNEEIIDLEHKVSGAYSLEIKQKLDGKWKQLKANRTARPSLVSEPSENPEITKEIEAKRTQKQSIQVDYDKFSQLKGVNNQQRNAAEKLSTLLDRLQNGYEQFKKNAEDELAALKIEVSKLVTFEIHHNILDAKNDELNQVNIDLETKIDGFMSQIETLDEEILSAQEELHGAHAEYQSYLQELQNWMESRRTIIGNEDREGSLLYYRSLRSKIVNKYPSLLERKKSERLNKMKDIFGEIEKLKQTQEELFSRVREYMRNEVHIINEYDISFEVSIDMQTDFVDRFLRHIYQGIRGTFYGADEGRKITTDCASIYDFNLWENIPKFIEDLIDRLKYDYRDHEKRENDVKRQLMRDVSLQELYDFLYGLDYLKPNYMLKLSGRDLVQLSPGERGILLLIFYLLIDRDDRPLLIDQPEENLDNQSIYEMLVDCIKVAKRNRQIIMITHNPNLAVVCDADQIIYAEMDKENKNKITYRTGAIESKWVNKKLVDILEGTWPAFMKREAAYQSGNCW